MGVRILSDRENDMACLYCSTTAFAFGPIFCGGNYGLDAAERIEMFLRWLPTNMHHYAMHTIASGRDVSLDRCGREGWDTLAVSG